jgi:ectoine hydroxylase-related dioxygenase (phytanoyl-CoA dioxygenase family)
MTMTHCQALRDYILDYRAASQASVDQGQVPRHGRFAKCLLSEHRDDLLLPLSSTPQQALRQILPHLAPILDKRLGPDATLFELAALISDPGAQRQNIHPDHACESADDGHCQNNKPMVLTCFVALQPISAAMGPTLWFPRTHTHAMHARFVRRRVEDVMASASPQVMLLRSTPAVQGAPMAPGAAALFDSRILHAGTANRSKDESRVLFYFSFRRRGANVGAEGGSLGYGLDSRALTVTDILR